MLVHLNGGLSYRQIPYLDLLEIKSSPLPSAVIEVNGRASLYIIAQENILTSNDENYLSQLNDILASRADSRYFGIVEPGIIKIYPIGLFKNGHATNPIETIVLRSGNPALHHFLMGNIQLPAKKNNATADAAWLDNYLFDLLKLTAQSLRDLQGITDGQVLSLVGRALFARFIIDRGIVKDSDVRSITKHVNNLRNLFTQPSSVADTFNWMDKTFNGNLLLLSNSVDDTKNYDEFFQNIGVVNAERICNELTNIMQGSINGQQQLNWARIHFDHVPADMLGQVYEYFAHAYTNKEAKEASVHYTPRHIAQILVDSAFDGLQFNDKSYVKVLDPSVGAGVFLVLSFKRLVQERWRITGQRPQREAIREILNSQLTGLDINPESLKFAALSLYLTALELDPDTNPDPLNKLRFTALNNKVLFNVGDASLKHTDALGSLSESLSKQFNHKYDMVIGNPPWTKQGLNVKPFTNLVQRIAREHNVIEEDINQLQVDGGIPDIPFVWRAMEWAKPGGMIAYALHAQHLLFKQGKGAEMRRALMQCIEVTGIMNGSAMRQEKGVWPNIVAPFCLLVACNRKPQVNSAFHYLSPYAEKSVNQHGQLRLDPQAAITVMQKTVQNSPFLFETLFRGTWLDHDIVQRLIKHIDVIPLSEYWDSLKLKNGIGFQVATKKDDASILFGNKLFVDTKFRGSYLNVSELPELNESNYPKLHRIRDRNIYRGPLVLFRRSPKEERCLQGGILSIDDVVFDWNFIGYSCANHPQSQQLAKYLHLLSCSNIFLYLTLMVSSQFGAERETLQKEDIDLFPIIPFDTLSQPQLAEITQISQKLAEGKIQWLEIDKFVASIYALNEMDMQVISDTLATALPYFRSKTFADSPPSQETTTAFTQELENIVSPFAERVGLSFKVENDSHPEVSDWQFLRLSFVPDSFNNQVLHQTFITELANHFWASQIRVQLDSAGYEVQIGQLAQNRYWTKTRARILALNLINNELDKLCKENASVH